MKRVLATMVLMVLFASMYAGPADPTLRKKIVLDDGTEKTVRLIGDEFAACWQSVDDGTCYVLDQKTGKYAKTSLKAVQQEGTTMRKKMAKAVQQVSRRAASGYPRTHLNTKGTFRVPVVLVQFPDKSFKAEHTASLFNKVFNQKGFNEIGNFHGSVKDYFLDQSGNQLIFEFEVMGPVTVSNNSAYYGENIDGKFSGHEKEMVTEALTLCDDNVDYSRYDWDGDGKVEMVAVIYAGDDEAVTGNPDDIWAHQSRISMVTDQVFLSTYACASELRSPSGKESRLQSIGTICHELSHCFGLPDTYTYSENDYGLRKWDIMASGVHNDDGYTPAGYTAYDKMFCGWQEPIILRENTTVSNMKPMSEGGDFYLIPNDANTNEFYLLENRQQTNWDEKLPGHGMLITHIDYDEYVFSQNIVNRTDVSNNDHERIAVVLADNDKTLDISSYDAWIEDYQGDLYPTSYNNALTNTSTPNAMLYNRNIDGSQLLSKPVTDISENNDMTMRFTFMNNLLEQDILCLAIQEETFRFTSETSGYYEVNLTNKGYQPYQQTVFFKLYNKADRDNAVAAYNTDINIASGKTTTCKFEFSGLVADQDYEIEASYYTNSKQESTRAIDPAYSFSMSELNKTDIEVDEQYQLYATSLTSAQFDIVLHNKSYKLFDNIVYAFTYGMENGQYVNTDIPGAYVVKELPGYSSDTYSFEIKQMETDKMYYIFLFYLANGSEWTQLAGPYTISLTETGIAPVVREQKTIPFVSHEGKLFMTGIDGATKAVVSLVTGETIYQGTVRQGDAIPVPPHKMLIVKLGSNVYKVLSK